MLKKFPSDKINSTKTTLFFFCELQLITVLLLICNSYMSWSRRSVSLKLCLGFSILDSILFFIKVCIFVQQNAWTLWLYIVKIPSKIKTRPSLLHFLFNVTEILKIVMWDASIIHYLLFSRKNNTCSCASLKINYCDAGSIYL